HYPSNPENVIRPLTPRELGNLQQPHNEKLVKHQYKLLRMCKLVPLEERKQLPLTKEQAKKLWDRAEELAHLDALPEVIVGKFGLTANLIRNVDFALKGRKLVRVKIGSTAPSLSPKFVAFVLENTLDCATVRTKGYTVTIFRG
uniref:mL127 n=1 Tax=Polytomella magna TaxID=353565 RepID=UPI002240E38C|nr:Chain Xh, mL127 [Polytomella magna]8APN_Xh Chain Xh, mL127 [Polytomella magna]8APO_Xh Chain Xh, mL127 [Polytomella magna]